MPKKPAPQEEKPVEEPVVVEMTRMPPLPQYDDEEKTIEKSSEESLREVNKELLNKRKREETLEEELAKAKEQQAKLAQLLTAEGVKSIRDNRARIFKAKDALAFINAGVDLQRKLLGMDEEQGSPVINIIQQQQSVFNKYVKKKEVGRDE